MEGFLEEAFRDKAWRVRSTGICWESEEGDSVCGGMKGASHLVLSPFLPEIHLIVHIWLGQTMRQLVCSIDNQNLLCLVEHQDRWGWLHWRKQNGTCQDLPQATEHACPCLQAGLLLTQRGDSSPALTRVVPSPWVPFACHWSASILPVCISTLLLP